MINNPSPSLLVPLSLATAAKLHTECVDNVEDQNLVEYSCSKAEATVLASWGLSGSDLENDRGVVMGCADGALYVFQPPSKTCMTSEIPSRSLSISVADIDTMSGPHTPSHQARRYSRSAYSSSRPVSPSLAFHQPTFNITSRSRVVSGISKEQVEAPKNYVDFDDEPGKLKEMLKGKSLRDKIAVDNLVPSSDKGLLTEKLPSPPVSSGSGSVSKYKDDPRSLLSTMSPPFTPKSLSTPASPKLLLTTSSGISPSTYALSLRCHILPRCPGPVSAVRLLDDNRLLVVLQNTGDISIFKTKDGACIIAAHAAPTGLRSSRSQADGSTPVNAWSWKRLCFLDAGESTIILACAGLDLTSASALSGAENGGPQEQALVVMFELFVGGEHRSYDSKLEQLGQWCIEGSVEGLGLYREGDNNMSFFFIDTHGHFITQRLRILPRVPPPVSDGQHSESSSHNLASLPLHNPFKATKPKSSENVSLVSSIDTGRIAFDDKIDAGELLPPGSFVSLRTRCAGGKLHGIVWTDSEMKGFEYHNKSTQSLFIVPAVGIRDINWIDEDAYLVIFKDRCESYALIPADPNRNEATQDCIAQAPMVVQPRLLQKFSSRQSQALEAVSVSEILSTTIDKSGRREVEIITGDGNVTAETKSQSRKLWRSARKFKSATAQLTSMLPLELDFIIFGYDDGLVRRCSFARLTERRGLPEFAAISDVPLNGSIVALYQVQNERTKERFIVGGSDDGCIALWLQDSLELCARWTVFTTPLAHATQIRDEKAGLLNGCVLCVSEDGTIAVIVVDGLQFLHLVPGSTSPLLRVCIEGRNMLLMYADGRVRLWDTQTTEFRRSTSIDKAEELLGQGGWTEFSVTQPSHLPGAILSVLPSHYQGLDTRSTLLLDLEAFLSEISAVKAIDEDEKPSALHRLRTVLSMLLIPGLSDDIDCICRENLQITTPFISAGLTSLGSTVVFATTNPGDLWCISSEFSAARALSIAAVLRVLGLVEALSDDCNTAVTFYATSLPQVVGDVYQPPNLAFLAWHWFKSSNELRQAARILVDAGIAQLSDEGTIALTEQWQHDLPCLQPDAGKEILLAAMSLFLCGYIATENYSLLSTSSLTDISKSIALYLHDEKSLYRALAIDLCSRGFHIWQHYVDAMEMLRALFNLATNSRKETLSTQNVGSQARIAVLQIAASNTPLFMTTLGLDILHPRTVEHRKSTMQLVAFLIRKRPLVLYPNLPRLMEAVVKSLDPNSTASRDAVLDTATEILGHVVKTFPTVDFYMANQRLAVGTNEGAIIMYDLKTATRLYVLEGHKKRLAACSFSPDGRRLVSVSLEEGVVLVWKVGSSLSSFFNPGAPPRQGRGGSQPYKTLAFNVGDEANMIVADTLEWVRFEWTAERSVKLKIREVTLTFST